MFLTRLRIAGDLVMALILIGIGAGLLGARLAVAEGPGRRVAVYGPEPVPAEHKPHDNIQKAIDRVWSI
jgi:hypothetical protein